MRSILAAALLGGLAGCGGGEPPVLRPDAGQAEDADLSMLSCAEDVGVQRLVFEVHCADSDCHDADRPKAELDLVSPGLTSRIVGRRSVHEECLERELVIPGNARGSFMLDKVLGLQGRCGDPMPIDAELPLEARRCLVEWIDAME